MDERAKKLLSAMGINEVAGSVFVEGWEKGQGEAIRSLNPTTGSELITLNGASEKQWDAAVKTSLCRFHEWRMRPAPQRGEVVRQLGEKLRQHRDALGELVALEMGKIKAEGIGEVQEMIDICDFAVGLSRQLYGLTIASERAQHRMMEQWHPLGPVGIVTAFNFPVAVWAWNAALAAICGNTCIWKPSPHTPLVSVAVQHIASQVMKENSAGGLFTLVSGGVDAGQWVAADKRIALVSFTGSTEVGRDVAATVSRRLGKSLLELGGNNGLIVMDDADLDLATRALLFGAVGTAGQRCTTTRRLLAHSSIITELSGRLVKAYGSVNIGDPTAEGTLMGPLCSEASVKKFESSVASARQQGGEVLCGGSRVDGSGFFVQPTIVRVPKGQDFPIAMEETFAPILYVFEIDSLDEAITMHNSVAHGLSSAIFTESMRNAERFVSAIGSDCGIANVNLGTSGAEIGGAFGGEKDTGGGRESGSDAWKAYMRRQTCTVNWGGSLPLAQGVEFG